MGIVLKTGEANRYFWSDGKMRQAGDFDYKFEGSNLKIWHKNIGEASPVHNAPIGSYLNGDSANAPFANQAALETWIAANFFKSAGGGNGAPSAHTHAASDITSGTLAPARLAAGTPTNDYYIKSVSGVPTWVAGTPGGGAGWSLSGNSDTNSASDYVGTTDTDLIIKSYATKSIRCIANRVMIGGYIDGNSNGGYAAVMFGGQSMTINGGSNYAFTIAGNGNQVSGVHSGTIGGESSHANGNYCYTIGSYVNTGGYEGAVMIGDHNNSPISATAANALYLRFLNGIYFYNSSSVKVAITAEGMLQLFNVPVYANNDDALEGEEMPGTVYRTADGTLKIVFEP